MPRVYLCPSGVTPGSIVPRATLSRFHFTESTHERLCPAPGLGGCRPCRCRCVATRAGAQALPDAKELIAKYGKAVGGDNVEGAQVGAHEGDAGDARGRPAGRHRGDERLRHARFLMKTRYPGHRRRCWVSTARPPGRRIRRRCSPAAGCEGAQAAEEADPEASLRTSSNIVKSETVEKTNMNNQDCYKVTHTWKSGRISHDCFALSSGLIVATILKQTSPMGEMEVTSFLNEYKDFGGVKRAIVDVVSR